MQAQKPVTEDDVVAARAAVDALERKAKEHRVHAAAVEHEALVAAVKLRRLEDALKQQSWDAVVRDNPLAPLPPSTTTREQSRWTEWREFGGNRRMRLRLRYDDACGNGHNTFSITGETERRGLRYWVDDSCGAFGAETIAPVFPELAGLTRWHLVSADGPLHYEANTLFWVHEARHPDGEPRYTREQCLDNARSSAVWPDATEAELLDPNLHAVLRNRLPALMAAFRDVVVGLGFIY